MCSTFLTCLARTDFKKMLHEHFKSQSPKRPRKRLQPIIAPMSYKTTSFAFHRRLQLRESCKHYFSAHRVYSLAMLHCISRSLVCVTSTSPACNPDAIRASFCLYLEVQGLGCVRFHLSHLALTSLFLYSCCLFCFISRSELSTLTITACNCLLYLASRSTSRQSSSIIAATPPGP